MKYTIATFLLATVLITTTFAQNLVINVGEGGLKYNPASITAAPGSTITFVWINTIPHSVVQSDSADSCTPTVGGFNRQMKAGESWVLKVPTDRPKVWFYCNVSTHCQQGMKGVLTVSGVNPPSGGNSTNPGDSPNTSNGSPTAMIAGIAAASIVLVVILGLLFYRRNRDLADGRENGNDGGNIGATRDVESSDIALSNLSSSSITVPSLQYPTPALHAVSSAPFLEIISPLHTTGESITSSLATSTDDSKMTVTPSSIYSPVSTGTAIFNRNRHNGLTEYRDGNTICHAEDKAMSEDAKVKDISNHKLFEHENIFLKRRRASPNIGVFCDQYEVSDPSEWKYTRMSLDRYITSTGKSGSTERIITRLPDCRPLLNILNTYLIIERLKASKVAEKYRNSSESMIKCIQGPPALLA
ncbi:2743_t:CDS:2 [Paraglomus brasilianum]|uniref:2743_t:CDS:1 n=1 Tax=Paraglomus brasilianum TaxID=144538 RepID=A0A9N8WIJ7_9GLOM|nr:2743_t:CDS:2 [Paraglomus brasilianum]